MASYFCAIVVALVGFGIGCTRTDSLSLSSQGDYLALSARSGLSAPNSAANSAATGDCTTRTVLPLKPVSHAYSGLYPIHVVCSTAMVADLARAVGGGQVKITQLFGVGVDPHLYKASPGDVSTLNDADLVLFSGLHLESKLSPLFEYLGPQKPTYAVTQYIPGQSLLTSGGPEVDPHVWLDVSLWRRALDVVRDALAMYDPIHADEYQLRATDYAARLDALQDDVKSQLSQVPSQRRVLVTAHNAFQYFGRAYGFEVYGIQGCDTQSDAAVRQIDKLVDLMVQRNITTVFPESSVSDQNLLAVVEGCRTRGHSVAVGPQLLSDAPGVSNTNSDAAQGYLDMIRHNADAIVSALK